MKVPIYSVKGKASKSSTTLPTAFEEPVRLDLIRRAVRAARANRRQAYGASKGAGFRHSVSWPGKGRGMARTPRKNGGSGRGAEAPNTVGGRRAHPPKVEKEWDLKINSKEKKKAFRSALAATSQESYVSARGHELPEKATLPYVVEDKIENIASEHKGESLTKRAMAMLDGLGLGEDVDRSTDGKGIRAGKGKRRGRKYRTPISVLIVLSENNGSERAFRNLSGVDVTTAKELNTELLAPGGDPGRLVVFSKAAVSALGDRL
jgi:large subunit ribosomal protein L4e